ncbi:MAG: GNAT family N-acetyltransferase [Pseudomonadota bacterium]
MASFTTPVTTAPIYHQSSRIAELEISVVLTAEEIRDEWLDLQNTGIATPYQSFDWVKTWQTSVGEPAGEDIRIITVRDESGSLVAILPVSICRSWGATVAKWVSDSLINYGMPVMGLEFARIASDNPFQFLRLVGEVLEGVDALHLGKQPASWDGVENPFADTFTDIGTNRTYLTNLPADFDSLYHEKRSARTRRCNRRREAKLMSFGDIAFGLPQTSEEAAEVLDTLFSFVQHRLGKQGIKDPYGEKGRTFYAALAQLPTDSPLQLRPYFMKTGDDIVAINMGADFKDRFCCLVCSIIDGSQAAYSPGDLALSKTIEACCSRELEIFDLSAGDSPYKFHWADETVPLADSVFPATATGYGYAALMLPQLSTKRVIKNSEWLWGIASRARKIAAPMRVGLSA